MTRTRLVGLLAAAALTAAAGAAAAQPVSDGDRDTVVLARFHDAVVNYVSHHRITEAVDLETLCLPENVAASAPQLDVAPAPREGDIFTPEVAAVFRQRIAASGLRRSEPPPATTPVLVGGRLGPGRSAPVPRAVATVLPPLPEDLRYRLVGRDLVLLDLRANVVVDALRDWRST